MRISKLFGKTQREIPAEADLISHQLLLRAGMIGQVATGIYSYLPLAWRVLRKIENIIREEMNRAGGQEVNLPVLQPLELWQETGRDQTIVDGSIRLTLFNYRPHRGKAHIREVRSSEGKTVAYVVSNKQRNYGYTRMDVLGDGTFLYLGAMTARLRLPTWILHPVPYVRLGI